jgi:cellulose biosynthesis protein BcsQ
LPGKIISVVNRKGGVGKTTVTLGLADTLIAETEKPYNAGAPVILTIDLDPQGSLTRALLYDRGDVSQQTRLQETFKKNRTFAACLQDHLNGPSNDANHYLTHGVGPIGKHYSMLANEATAWNVERDALRTAGEARLKEAVKSILIELASAYRYVLIDAPPGQTLIAEAAIQASHLVLCPTSPDLLSFWGLESFDQYLKEICAGENAPPARFLFTKFKKKAPQYDPQDRVHEWISAFSEPDHYVTLLRETGAKSAIGGQSINLPFDPKLVSRLEGPPNPGRLWPWTRMYTRDTQLALLRLVSAVKRELTSGEPRRTPPHHRTTNRAITDAAGSAAQIAG